MYGAIRVTAFNEPDAFKQGFRIDSFYHDKEFLFELDRFPGSEGVVMGKDEFILLLDYMNEVSNNIKKEDESKYDGIL